MKLQAIDAPDFDLALTLGSGQVFHWEKQGKGFVGTIGEKAVYAEQRGAKLLFSGADRDVIVKLLCARSSAQGNLRFFSARRDHESSARFLLRASHHSSAEMGMSCHVHLFFDEASRAYSTNFARSTDGVMEDRSNSPDLSLHAFPTSQPTREDVGSGAARLRAWLSREEFARDGAAGRIRQGESRKLGRHFQMTNCAHAFASCRASERKLRTASCSSPTNDCALFRSMSGSSAF